MDKMSQVFNSWKASFGAERAEVIASKVINEIVINKRDLFALIKLGEQWHYLNLFLNEKITFKEFQKEMKK